MAQIPSPIARKRPRIEIIPLIDIMFFLLATFMMVSIGMIRNEGIELRLPAAGSSEPHNNDSNAMVVSISKEGAFFIDAQPMTLEDIRFRLADFKASGENKKLILQSDGEAHFDRFVTVMDEARSAGLVHFVIRTQKPEDIGSP